MVRQLCQRDIAENGLATKLSATTDRREALRGAKYVFCVARIGGLEGFKTDIEVPLRYGVDQCVGDTLCAGGIMYGQRGIAAILDFCKDNREVAAPGTLFNYSNPMAMLTWPRTSTGRQDGRPCHGVEGGYHQIAKALGLAKSEIDIIAAGSTTRPGTSR
jgi:alpha-galactosidase